MIHLKESTKWEIHDFSLHGQTHLIQGTRLKALYKLIQIHGFEIQSQSDNILNGQKALEFRPNEYVAIIHYPTKPGSFFPCKIDTAHLTHLKKPEYESY